MKILKPYDNDPSKFTSLNEDYMKNAIFLAGPCPRKDYSDDWRFEAFDILEKSTPFKVGANPTVTKHKLNKPNNIIFLIPFIITTYFF